MKVYTVAEAAQTLKTHPNIIRKLLHEGRLGGFRIGRAWRIAETDLETYAACPGRFRAADRGHLADLMQAQETALKSVWDNAEDEVWNDA